jgi:hypothetical protein
VNQTLGQEYRSVWSLWAAAGILVVGGLMPLVFGGTSSRVASVIFPFVAGAIALAAIALFHTQSRTVLAVIYFVAGLAIVYGLLSMFSLPVRLAVLGTCPALPAPCTSGLERPLTDGENTGMGAAAALGIVAIFMGFFGLVTIFRRPVVPQFSPPVRKIPPVARAAPATAPQSAPAPPAPEPAPEAKQAEPADEPEPELPAHEEEELPELPPHESSSATT